MHLRPLTDKEKDLIREAKKQANAKIRAERRHLRSLAEYASSAKERREARKALNRLRNVSGWPVQASDMLGGRVLLDYEDLRKFARSLKGYTVRYWLDPEKTELEIVYERCDGARGKAKWWGLPQHWEQALEGIDLPEVAI